MDIKTLHLKKYKDSKSGREQMLLFNAIAKSIRKQFFLNKNDTKKNAVI